jgi:effector-binding domain-containing protein
VQKWLYGIGGLLALLLIVGFALPRHSRFVIARDIDAPAATIFAQLNDLRRSRLWSRTARIDPNAEIRYSGPARGAGATASWDGPVAGSGTQTIVESQPHTHLATLINAGKPEEARTWFDLAPVTAGTRVEWRYELDHGFNLPGRYLGLATTAIIRRDYEHSLANLADLAESLPDSDFSELRVERTQVQPQEIAFQTMRAAPDAASMSAALGEAYTDILAFMDAHDLRPAGPPLSIAREFSGARLEFDAGIPVVGVTDETPQQAGEVRLGQTAGGPVLRATHKGAYRNLAATHRMMSAYLAALGIERDGDAWESYVSDPAEVPEADLLTYVYYPVRDDL